MYGRRHTRFWVGMQAPVLHALLLRREVNASLFYFDAHSSVRKTKLWLNENDLPSCNVHVAPIQSITSDRLFGVLEANWDLVSLRPHSKSIGDVTGAAMAGDIAVKFPFPWSRSSAPRIIRPEVTRTVPEEIGDSGGGPNRVHSQE
jgi:hypothetical protein